MAKRRMRGISFLLIAVMVFVMTGSHVLSVMAEESAAESSEEVAEPASYIYQAEDYYSGNISEGIAADMQPGESITFTLDEDFVSGRYALSVYSCGNRESFTVKVNGESVGTISRSGTGYGQDQMTLDTMSAEVKLEAGNEITIVAPDGGYYGWVDYIQLDQVTYYTYQAEDYYSGNISEGVAADMQPGESIAITLNTNGDFAAGTYTLSINSCGNRESFEILVNGESVGTLTRTGTNFGLNEMTLDELTSDEAAVELELGTDDVITIVAPDGDYYGWVDYMRLYSVSSDEEEEDSEEASEDESEEPSEDESEEPSEDESEEPSEDESEEPSEDESEEPSEDESEEPSEDESEEPSEDESEDPDEKDTSKMPDGATETGDGYYVYQIEYYYSGTTVEEVAADMQPGDKIDVALNTNSDFVAGTYTLTVYSCGNREEIQILVNGKSVGTITRTGTGFGQDQMTYDVLSAELDLKPTDTITLYASDSGYGWVDFMILSEEDADTSSAGTGSSGSGSSSSGGSNSGSSSSGNSSSGSAGTSTSVPDAATETGDGYYVYQVEYYYSGTIVEDVAADMQPGESISIAVSSNSDFVAGTYTLTVYSCGNRTQFEILVNGVSVGTITRTGTGFGQDQMTYDLLSTQIYLKPGDVITLAAPGGAYYGWVDFMILSTEESDTSSLTFALNSSASATALSSTSSDATESYDDYLIYQAEYYYTPIAEEVTADLQPGESIDIDVSTNSGFTPGTYTLTICSCGNREEFDIQVNGVSVGTVNRTGTGFGLDQMTYDKLTSTVLELEENDVISLVGQSGEYYGWVDFIVLDRGDTTDSAASASDYESDDSDNDADTAVITGDTYFIYQGEDFYEPIVEEAADLQPGESITFELNTNSEFTSGTYVLTVSSCGNREEFDVQVNGVSVGTINRTGTGFGMDQMTNDQLATTLNLETDDTITIVSPDGEVYGWVDYIRLDLVTDAEEASEELVSEEEESTGDDTQNDSEADATPEDADDSNSGSGAWIPVVIGIIAVLCCGGIAAAVIITRRRRNTAGAGNA